MGVVSKTLLALINKPYQIFTVRNKFNKVLKITRVALCTFMLSYLEISTQHCLNILFIIYKTLECLLNRLIIKHYFSHVIRKSVKTDVFLVNVDVLFQVAVTVKKKKVPILRHRHLKHYLIYYFIFLF